MRKTDPLPPQLPSSDAAVCCMTKRKNTQQIQVDGRHSKREIQKQMPNSARMFKKTISFAKFQPSNRRNSSALQNNFFIRNNFFSKSFKQNSNYNTFIYRIIKLFSDKIYYLLKNKLLNILHGIKIISKIAFDIYRQIALTKNFSYGTPTAGLQFRSICKTN